MTTHSDPGALRRSFGNLRSWFKLTNRRRTLGRTVASVERSPAVVALDGPFRHDNVFVRGIRLHVTVAGSPTDPLIVLVHGAFGGWHDYRDVLAPLASAGFHVAAVDLRGYGMSDKPPSGYDLRHGAGDLNGLIAALGHDDALLIGSDTGSSIIWTTATMYPDRVRGIVSLGAIHPLDMRRAILRRPYLYTADISRILLFGLPVPVFKALRFLIPSAARRQVLRNTSPSYQRSNTFLETVRLRQKALSIDHTLAPIVRNNRLLTGSVPAKLSRETASAPIWILKQNTHRWDHLCTIARSRTTGPVHLISIPGATELPFLEQPQEFAALLSQFAKTL